MSKFNDSVYMAGQRGKIGATVMSRNRSGPYAKINTIPVNPNTEAQQNSRLGLARFSRQWNYLTDVQRLSWEDAALDYPVEKNGKVYFSSAKNFFVKINRIRQEIGEPMLLNFPRVSFPQSFDNFSVEYVNTPTGIDLILNISPAIDPDTKLRLCATRGVNRGVSFKTVKHYKIAVLDSTFISGSSIKDIYINKYGGLPPLDKKIYFTIQPTNIACGFSSIIKVASVVREFI